MKQSIVKTLLVILLGIMPYLGYAEVPGTMSYQGYLSDTADKTISITFSIPGTSWTETHTGVQVNKQGVFGVMLGTKKSLTDVDFSKQRDLQIDYNGTTQKAPLASVPYAFHAGTVGSGSAGGDKGNLGNVPIGTIMAWHKSMADTPPLPDEWVECNGQELNDPESPYYRRTIPNLNSANGYEGGKFLRGGTTSGVTQEASEIHHETTWGHNNQIKNADGQYNSGSTSIYQTGNNGSYASPWYKLRPINMSVVWIMRVK